jgi:hypothetical protein
MKLRVSGDASEQLVQFFDNAHSALKKAAKETIKKAADEALQRGRADIAAAGFGRRWQDGLRVTVYPRGRGISINSIAYVNHDLKFASVFEEGATIHGKPLLWVPLPNVPKTIGGKKTTAALYAKTIGRMFQIRGSTGRLLLARREGKKLIPLFVGLDSITIRKRFHIHEIVDKIRQELPIIFDEKMKAEV